MRICVVLISVLFATGCTAGSTTGAQPTTTVTATVTATPSLASDPLEGLFEDGFPAVISVDTIPDYMQPA